MTFHFGLILVIVTTLTITQSALEQLETSGSRLHPECAERTEDLEQPLLERRQFELRPVMRPGSNSKTDDTSIHPTYSNLTDALGSELVISESGNMDRSHVNAYKREEGLWNAGEGKEAAHSGFRNRHDSSSDSD